MIKTQFENVVNCFNFEENKELAEINIPSDNLLPYIEILKPQLNKY